MLLIIWSGLIVGTDFINITILQTQQQFYDIIVWIEFSPLVEISVNKGHYYPEETSDEGPTRVDAETGTFLKTYQ